MGRLSAAFNAMHLEIVPGPAIPGTRYEVKDIFTTHDGSWEPSGDTYAPPQWAINDYLTPSFDDAGAATHILVRVEDEKGQPISAPIAFYNGARLDRVLVTGEKFSDWCNFPLWSDSSFDAEAGQSGSWAVSPVLSVPCDKVVGLGLPNRWHISTFIVFERKVNGSVPPVPPVPPTPDPVPVDPVPVDPTQTEHYVTIAVDELLQITDVFEKGLKMLRRFIP